MLHVDMFAHNKSGIAYRDRSRQPESMFITRGNPTSSEAATQSYQISGRSSIEMGKKRQCPLYNASAATLVRLPITLIDPKHRTS
jgi:hypothetical protein